MLNNDEKRMFDEIAKRKEEDEKDYKYMSYDDRFCLDLAETAERMADYGDVLSDEDMMIEQERLKKDGLYKDSEFDTEFWRKWRKDRPSLVEKCKRYVYGTSFY